jgi:histidinol dehydrogenase
MIQIFNLTKQSDKPGLFDFSAGRQRASLETESAVKPILEAIRRDGDEALVSYAREFDGLGNQSLRVKPEDLEKAASAMSADIKKAVEVAVANIRQFAEAQLPKDRFEEFSPGRKLGWIVRPSRCRRLLRAVRALSAPVHSAHDRRARANRRRASHLRHFPASLA